MPELPEVETMVRGIASAVEGRRIESLVLTPCRCKPLDCQPAFPSIARKVRGLTVSRVLRRAKRIVFELHDANSSSRASSTSGSQSYLVIEPRMTGLMLLADPPDVEHLRLEWRLAKGRRKSRLWYWDRRGLGTVRLFTNEQFHEALGPAKLGPDALEMTAADWRDRLAATSRAIKVVLLDQRVSAGIGNLYASEILHLSRIHPETPSDSLSSGDIKRMQQAVIAVLETAIRYEGSTLGDGTYRNALNKAGGYQNEHQVYSRAGERCLACKRETIVRIVQAQRSTFFCPRCQKQP